jgi:D-tyrosyl-tRNA(Tyr) deacylase
VRVVVQRSLNSKVTVDGKISGSIKNGLVLLVGFNKNDTVKDIDYMVKKIVNLRIFDDSNHIMNKSVIDVSGSILSISQFTLYAETKKGNRPSYINAMNSVDAKKLYDIFNEKLKQYVTLETGIFKSNMLVSIENDGPITIILDSD